MSMYIKYLLYEYRLRHCMTIKLDNNHQHQISTVNIKTSQKSRIIHPIVQVISNKI